MNRPFYAFGALSVFLALAVLAVSSTNRSTSVQTTGGQPTAAGAVVRGATGAKRFSGIYVIVLPAAERDLEFLAAPDGEAPWMPSYAYGCGFDRCTGQVYSPAFSECLAYRRTKPLDSAAATLNVSAQIKLARHDAALSCQGDSRNCLSHYDAVYDAAVYGDQAAASGEDSGVGSGVVGVVQQPAIALIIRPSDVELHYSMTLFRSLIDQDVPQMPSAGVLQKHFRQGQTMWRGLENAVDRALGRWNWLEEWQIVGESSATGTANEITWDDYSELFERAERNTIATSPEAESTSGVQSGRWLLRFAASRLNAASDLLSTVAIELERAAGETRLATEASESQR